MGKRSWNSIQPTSVREAMKACLDYAYAKHNLSVAQVATLMGVQSEWRLRKWMQEGRLPANKIRPFELACGATYVTRHITASAHFIPVRIPTGRAATGEDMQQLQSAVTDATGRLFKYYQGEASAEETLAAIDRAMSGLAYQRANVQQGDQPALDLEAEDEE